MFLSLQGVFADVTLYSDGEFIEAHRFVLVGCSEVFAESLSYPSNTKPMIILQDVPLHFLKLLLDYMYLGEITILNTDMTGFLAAAQKLKIRGLLFAVQSFQKQCEPAVTPEPTTIELARQHTDYVIDKYSIRPVAGDSSAATTLSGDRSKSPPHKKRKRSRSPAPEVPMPFDSSVAMDSTEFQGTANVSTANADPTPDSVSAENLSNGDCHPSDHQMNNSTASEDRAMPLVKVEMQDDDEFTNETTDPDNNTNDNTPQPMEQNSVSAFSISLNNH